MTHYWQSTKRKLFTLEISPGKWERTSRTQWPTTKATPFLITGLFHRVINLFSKLLGNRLLDSSPLVLAEQTHWASSPSHLKEHSLSEIMGCSGWAKVAQALGVLNPAWPQRRRSIYNSLLFAFWGFNHHSAFLLRNLLAMTLYCDVKIGMSFQENT